MQCATESRQFVDADRDYPLSAEEERDHLRDAYIARAQGYAARFRGLRDAALSDLRAHGCHADDIAEFADLATDFLADALHSDPVGPSARNMADIMRLDVEAQTEVAQLKHRLVGLYADHRALLAEVSDLRGDRELAKCWFADIAYYEQRRGAPITAEQATEIAKRGSDHLDAEVA